jgi:hypothetical protein
MWNMWLQSPKSARTKSSHMIMCTSKSSYQVPRSRQVDILIAKHSLYMQRASTRNTLATLQGASEGNQPAYIGERDSMVIRCTVRRLLGPPRLQSTSRSPHRLTFIVHARVQLDYDRPPKDSFEELRNLFVLRETNEVIHSA